MTFKNILNKIALAAMGACLLITPSCDYLDVVPDEQVSPKDAMKTYNGALGFLYSCYNKSANSDWGDLPYGAYLAEQFCTADDIINPHAWISDAGSTGQYILMNTLAATTCRNYWGHNFQGIGQCLFFLDELKDAEETLVARDIVRADEIDQWKHEAQALMAYYHFILLRRYGPIPICTERASFTLPQDQFQGRNHFDYCVEWICDQLDEAATGLPAVRDRAFQGRMTSTICKAIKAQVRFLAASPLWNGKFPYPDWKNKNYETPEYKGKTYGYELVSNTYDENKWKVALQTLNEAIQFAEAQGHKLFTIDDMAINDGINPNDIYIPDNTSEDFKKHVLLMRYVTVAGVAEGNTEAIMTTNYGDIHSMWWAMLPRQMMRKNDGSWMSGYSGVNPTLNAAKWFLTQNGLTIDNDPDYYKESEWYESAGLPDEGNRRDQIIKLNTHREPRFYAWLAFDGGDYGQKLAEGQPVHINLRSKAAQGVDLSVRDNCQTGYLCQKHLNPATYLGKDNYWHDIQNPARKVIRLAELYLDRAECAAQLGETDQALSDVNKIRSRAGAKLLTPIMINDQMTLMDWVKRERTIEFFAESFRFWDLRRWVEADKYLSLGMRMGLNCYEKENPSFEEFNKPVSLPYPYTWGPRLYLYPLPADDLYSNPQLVQAPGY